MKRSKYRAVRTEYNGVSYASKAEAAYAVQLDLEQRQGWVKFWIAQPTFRLGCPENVYRPDFMVVMAVKGHCSGCRDSDPLGGTHCEGTVEHPPEVPVYCVDVKGVETPKFRRDKKLWAKYGPCPLVVVRNGREVEVIDGV